MLPEIKKIKTKEEYEMVMKLAAEDNDSIMYPSHMIVKDDDIIGGISIGVIPLVTFWSDSEKVKAKDSLIIKSVLNSIMNDKGMDKYFMACNKDSKYSEYMEKLGYKPFWNTNIYIGGDN